MLNDVGVYVLPLSPSVQNFTDLYSDLSYHEVNERLIGHVFYNENSSIRDLIGTLGVEEEVGEDFITYVNHVQQMVAIIQGQLETLWIFTDNIEERYNVPVIRYVPITAASYCLLHENDLERAHSFVAGYELTVDKGAITAVHQFPSVLVALDPDDLEAMLLSILNGYEPGAVPLPASIAGQIHETNVRKALHAAYIDLTDMIKIMAMLPGAAANVSVMENSVYRVTIPPTTQGGLSNADNSID